MTDNESPELQEATLEEAMQAYHELKPLFPVGVVPGRATTNEEKRAIVERLYELWCKSPQLRLGQLLLNCLVEDFYYEEDEQLIEQLEGYYKSPEQATKQE